MFHDFRFRGVVPGLLTGVLALAAYWSAATASGEETKGVTFSKRCLMVNANEGCAVADVDKDGHLDIVAGPNWFRGPDFIPRLLRDIAEFGGDFMANNGDHVWDVDGDGWLDVISGGWMESEIYWFKNPGKDVLAKGMKWEQILLNKGRGENEAYDLKDFDGDGVPEIYVSCWAKDTPQVVWKLTKTADGKPGLQRFELGPKGGHGYGFGDINGDGREDVETESGWYERPEGNPLGQPWKFHPETALPHPSCPCVIVDVNGDGRNDLIWGKAHDFGLYWWEQGEPKADGTTTWTQHEIDKSWSQAHCLVWVDLDGDGRCELLAGKRVRGHGGADPGGKEPACLYYYSWDNAAKKFTRHTIGGHGENIGTGMQIRVVDLNGDKKPDIVVAGKTGTWVLLNEGVGK